jgi:hypothetical protein
VCADPTGDVTLYADGVQVGNPATGATPFDLASGHLVVGNNSPVKSAIAAWQGFVTKAAVCPAGFPGACQ